jgi:hypothetical protein
MLIDELRTYIFDGQPHLLDPPMATWLAASRRYAEFVATFRDKIRKKIRTLQDQESLLDLRLELETAYALLQERRLSLAYEPKHPGQARCPDFAVTFTTSLTFMLEVTRLRAQSPTTPAGAVPPTAAPLVERLADTVGGKLGQLLPQHSNVVLIGVADPGLTADDLRAVMLRIQQRAEHNEAPFLRRYHFRDRADFFQHYQRLSEILVRGPALQAAAPLVWVNPQAKHPLPARVRTALYGSFSQA